MIRFDELGSIHRKRFVHHLREFLREDDRDCASVTRVNRNWKGTGVAIVPVNRAIGFPNAIRVTGRMIAVANEQNFRPEVFVQLMLVFEDGEIIAGGESRIRSARPGHFRRARE